MDESSSRDCNEGDKRASCLPKKHGRIAKSIPTKPKERKRRFGIAELEKMRAEKEMKIEEEMREYFKEPLSLPQIHRAGIQGLVSTLVETTFGPREDISGPFKHPVIRLPGTSGGASYVTRNCTVPTTLHLFDEAPDHRKGGDIDLKRKDDDNLLKETTYRNFNDPQDLDLNLKL